MWASLAISKKGFGGSRNCWFCRTNSILYSFKDFSWNFGQNGLRLRCMMRFYKEMNNVRVFVKNLENWGFLEIWKSPWKKFLPCVKMSEWVCNSQLGKKNGNLLDIREWRTYLQIIVKYMKMFNLCDDNCWPPWIMGIEILKVMFENFIVLKCLEC